MLKGIILMLAIGFALYGLLITIAVVIKVLDKSIRGHVPRNTNFYPTLLLWGISLSLFFISIYVL